MRTIIGMGSLYCEDSARRTCPNLQNFRLGRLEGYCRVFAKVDAFRIASFDENFPRVACWGAEAHPQHSLIVSLFEIPDEDWNAFVWREADYLLPTVPVQEHTSGDITQGVLCLNHPTEDSYLQDMAQCPIKQQHFDDIYHQHDGPVWGRTDILPSTDYLQFCLNAAANLSTELLDNLLDHSYLADRQTTIRHYVMENQPLFEKALKGEHIPHERRYAKTA